MTAIDTTIPSQEEACARLLVVPVLSVGAPTLARHLAWALTLARWNAQHMTDGDVSDYNAAVSALIALPSVPAATETLGDKLLWRDEEGGYLPENLIKPHKLLEDLFARTVAGGALAISATLARFKAISFAEAQALIDTAARDYGVQMGGKVGNVSFFTYDRSFKVEIQVQERITVGSTIEIAKGALNEYLAEAEASDEVKAIITSAFGIGDQAGVRVAELVRLRRLNITHPKWLAAMKAIDEAMETAGKAIYLRVKRRRPDGKYDLVSLDLASA